VATPPEGDPVGELMSQLANLQNALGGAIGGGFPGLPGLGQLGTHAESVEIVGTAGGGAVRVHATGDLEFTAVEIDPAVIDPADASVLEDLVLAALRDVAEQMRRATEGALGEALGGLSGLFGALGSGGSAWSFDTDDADDDAADDADGDDADGDDADDDEDEPGGGGPDGGPRSPSR